MEQKKQAILHPETILKLSLQVLYTLIGLFLCKMAHIHSYVGSLTL